MPRWIAPCASRSPTTASMRPRHPSPSRAIAPTASSPARRVSVSVLARVDLPLVPDFLALTAIGSVPIEASATQTVSRFAGAGR